MGVSLASHPSEVIQSAWGTVAGLRAGSPVGGVNIRPKDTYFDFEIKEIQRIKNGVAYSTSANEVIDPDYTYRIKLVGTGKQGKTFSNGPWRYDHTFDYYVNTCVKLRMNNTVGDFADYTDALYDTASQAYTIELTPEPDVTVYDYLSLGAPYPWADTCPGFNNNWITGLPGGVTVRNYSWFDVESGAQLGKNTPFAAGRSYRFKVILDCEEGYYLADPEELDAYVNGNKALATEAAGGGVALTVEYSVAVSSGLRGQVASFHDDSDVTVALFADGSAQPQYTTTVPAGEKSGGKYTAVYDIPSVAAGTYTVQVSKKNHVTRAYTVTVGGDTKTLDTRIYLLGDVNGDGIVNIKDCSRLFKHVNKTQLLTDPYALKCANTNGDSAVNIKDCSRLFKHVNKTQPLW